MSYIQMCNKKYRSPDQTEKTWSLVPVSFDGKWNAMKILRFTVQSYMGRAYERRSPFLSHRCLIIP